MRKYRRHTFVLNRTPMQQAYHRAQPLSWRVLMIPRVCPQRNISFNTFKKPIHGARLRSRPRISTGHTIQSSTKSFGYRRVSDTGEFRIPEQGLRCNNSRSTEHEHYVGGPPVPFVAGRFERDIYTCASTLATYRNAPCRPAAYTKA